MLEIYLQNLEQEINYSAVKDFKNIESLFQDYSAFDKINFKLIHDYLLEDEKDDFFISIPEEDYRPKFFNSIFTSLLLIKLYQNFFHYTRSDSELKRGDLIYAKVKGENRIMEVKGKGPSILSVNYKFPKGKEKQAGDLRYENFKLFTKINPDAHNARTTSKKITKYFDFLKTAFGDSFPLITEFQRKTLVIAEKDFTEESKFLPVTYTTRKGIVKSDLPFFNHIIECCTDIEVAKQFILSNEKRFDEIVVIGDCKYIGKFNNIIEGKWAGSYKNIIFIGTALPDRNNKFIKWLWSVDEVKYANNETPSIPEKITIENEGLFEILFSFKNYLGDIHTNHKINLSFLLKYTNFYFRTVLMESEISKGLLREYSDRLSNYFESETFEKDFSYSFFKNDFYDIEKIANFKGKIKAYFDQISSLLASQNLKWEQIIEVSKDAKKVYLLVEKKNFDLVQSQIRKCRINNVTLISDKRIDSVKLNFDSWLKSPHNSKNALLIIPYLNNEKLYNCLKSIKGQSKILCYKDIDEIGVDKIINHFRKMESERISESGRKMFFSTEFGDDIIIKTRDLDSLFDFDWENEEFKNNPNESIDLPSEKLQYYVHFTDGSSEKFESSKGILIIEGSEMLKSTIGEVFKSAKIRFYQNDSREDFRKILEIFDEQKLLNHFDGYALSWKETLRKIVLKEGDIQNVYQKLFKDKKSINYVTFRNYYNHDIETRFPRYSTLLAIKEYCQNNNLEEELIVKEFNLFLKYSAKDKSLRQQAGRVLGNDLLDYFASNMVEKSPTLEKISDEILSKLVRTIKEKTIKEKFKIDYE